LNASSRILVCAAALGVAACAPRAPEPSPEPFPVLAWADDSQPTRVALLNRVTFGVNGPALRELAAAGGSGAYLARQLRPAAVSPRLPGEIQQRSVADLAVEMERLRQAGDQKAYQQALNRLGREAMARTLLRAIYSPDQLQEQMTWFWANHFSVFQFKANLRVLVADYEERAIRPHALGRFRTLLGAVARHPAMLVYLDNWRNSAFGLNENYARELMELHTLGVGGGYAQADVEALARVLTGFGVYQGEHRFFPKRHDWGTKTLLGRPIRARGERELDEALDLLASHPSTSRHVARKLAQHFVADDPPAALVDSLALTFQQSHGDIALTLRALFESPEFRASLGGKFKDPLHYLVSAARLALGERPIEPQGVQAMINALFGMGEAPYGRPTPDGYPLTRTEWAAGGQLATRFEVARGVGYRVPVRLRSDLLPPLGSRTRETLAKASSAQEWNMLVLASPEFMYR
jgi:uncharacterized protein (DUF1800 family)